MSSPYEALAPEARRAASAQASRLLHDVGKYVARMARNIAPEGPVPAALVPLLAKDLFELAEGRPASSIFAELAGILRQLVDEPRLHTVEELLSEVDAHEADIRAGDEPAVLRGAALAREVEATLRAIAKDAQASDPKRVL